MKPIHAVTRRLFTCGAIWGLFLGVATEVFPARADTTVPMVISHQGRLLDASGDPVNGNQSITLSLYRRSTGGSPLYQQTKHLLLVDGLYTFNFGEGEAVPETVRDALADGEVWLEISILGTPLLPRERWQSAPYSIWAERVVPGAVGTAELSDDAVTSAKIADGSVAAEDLDPSLIDPLADVRSQHESVFKQLAPLMTGEALPVDCLQEMTCSPYTVAMRVTISGFTHPTVLAFHAEERISDLLRVTLLFETGLGSVSPSAMINSPAELLWDRNSVLRRYSGVITRAARVGYDGTRYRFVVVIESYPARMRYTEKYQFYQDANAIDIVEGLVQDAGLSPVQTSASAPVRTSRFQVGESDLQFIQRLLEEEGIFFTFDDQTPQPRMVLGSQNSDFPGSLSLNYYGPQAAPPAAGAEYLTTFDLGFTAHAGEASVRSFNDDQGLILSGTDIIPGGIGEIHSLEEALANSADANTRANRRARADYHGRVRMGGFSTAGQLQAGRRLNLTDTTTGGYATGDYVVTAVTHTGLMLPGTTNCYYYGNRFELAHADVAYAPSRRTPKPKTGMLSGTVVGPAGSSLHVDELGRIKVKFHWDSSGVTDDSASAWIPVMRPVHGQNQSMFVLPEVGDEVVVSFLNGDPDRPIVMGSMVHDASPPHYNLPADKYRMYLRQVSTGNKVNEIRMDRTPGTESLSLLSDTSISLAAPEVTLPGVLDNDGVYQRSHTYGDNQIVAWARVASGGTLGNEHFGIVSVTNPSTGSYRITLDAPFALQGVIPVAVAEIDSAPSSLTAVRFTSVNQIGTSIFDVYINDGNGNGVNNDFVFMVTGR